MKKTKPKEINITKQELMSLFSKSFSDINECLIFLYRSIDERSFAIIDVLSKLREDTKKLLLREKHEKRKRKKRSS